MDGGQVSGASIIDPVWSRMVDWHGREERELAAARTRIAVESQVIGAKGEVAGRAILAAFDQLAA